MAYLPKNIVEKNIKVRIRSDKNGKPHTDYEAYLGVDPFTHRPARLTRTDRNDLLNALRNFYQRHQAGGDAAARLSAAEAIDAKNALDALAAAQMKMTLFDAVSAYIGGQAAQGACPEKRADEAFDEFFTAKPDGADKHKTKATTGKWVASLGGKRLCDIAAKEVAAYLERNYGGKKPKTYNSHLLYIKTFLNWCCKDERAYLAKNPISSMKFKPEPWEEPEYMKPADVECLFRLLEAHKEDRPELLAYATVNFFCGCRAVEIQRMASDPDAAKINIEGETVRIAKAKGYQQGKRPRAFPIHPTALAWMKSFDFLAALSKVTEDTQKEVYELARKNGVPMFQNCGRHTFITYHVAAYNDPAKTTAMVGTSEKMRADNYCGLASKAEGEAYFRIWPKCFAAEGQQSA